MSVATLFLRRQESAEPGRPDMRPLGYDSKLADGVSLTRQLPVTGEG